MEAANRGAQDVGVPGRIEAERFVDAHFPDGDGLMHYFPRDEGSRVWRTDLTVSADPGTPLTGCQVRLVDIAAQQRPAPRCLPQRIPATSLT